MLSLSFIHPQCSAQNALKQALRFSMGSGQTARAGFLGVEDAKLAALSQASRLTVAEDPILKSDPVSFGSTAVNRRRCSCPCSYVFLCRRVSSPLLCLCVSQICICSLAQCFGSNATLQRGGGSKRGAQLPVWNITGKDPA